MSIQEIARDRMTPYLATMVVASIAGFVVHRSLQGLPKAEINWTASTAAGAAGFGALGIIEVLKGKRQEYEDAKAQSGKTLSKEPTWAEQPLKWYAISACLILSYSFGLASKGISTRRIATSALTGITSSFHFREMFLNHHLNDKIRELKKTF